MATQTTKSWRPRLPLPLPRPVTAAIVLLFVAATAVAGFLLTRSSDLPEDAAFSVDDTVVESEQVQTRMKALQALYGIKRPDADEELASFRKDTAKSMAVEILIRREAEDAGIVIPAKRVEDMLAALVTERYPDGGRTAFVQALGELGASEQQVRDEIEQQMLVAQLFDHVTRDVEVSDADVREEFEARQADLGSPERRTLRNIVVSSEADAENVLSALRAGAPFAQVVTRSSLDSATRGKGGSLGTVAAAQLAPDFATAAFEAPVGQPFGPVQTEHGWNVGLVEQVVPSTPATYDAVAEQLRTTLLGERSFEVWRNWLGDLLRKADVTYADAFRPADPDAVPDLASQATAPPTP